MPALSSHDRIDRHVDEWVRAGIVSNDQADEIRRFEHRREEMPDERLTIGAEVASYLGSVLALMGGALVVGRRWEELGLAGQLGVAVAIAAVGFAAGWWLIRQGEVAMDRLGGFMWTVGAGGVAFFVGLATDRWGPSDEAWTGVAVGVSLFAVGMLLWQNLERHLQFLTAAVGFAVAAGGLAGIFDVPGWLVGLVLLALGLGVASAAAMGRLAPRLTAIATGGVGAFAGAMSLTDLNRHLGPFAGLAVAGAAIVFALVDRATIILILGVVGSLIATQALLMTTFDGAIASMIVALLGLAIVVAVLVWAGHRPPHHPAAPGPA